MGPPRRRPSIFELPTMAASNAAAAAAPVHWNDDIGGGGNPGVPLDDVLMSSEETEEAAREAFSAYDADGSGDLDYDELVSLVTELFHAGVADDSVREWCVAVFSEMDPDGNGVLDFDEYVQVHNKAVKNWATAAHNNAGAAPMAQATGGSDSDGFEF